MKFKILVMAVMAMGLVLATAMAADVTGKWTSERPGRGGETMTTTFNFKADGTALTGTVSSPMGGDNAISEGKIDGDNISFVVKMEMMGNEMTMKYKGTVAGDEIKMTMEFEGGMGGPGGGGPGGGGPGGGGPPKAFEMTLKRAK